MVVERQLFLLDQLGRGERGELLRYRGRIKERVTIERLAGRDVAGAGCSDEESLPSAKSAGGASGRSEALRVGYDFPYLDDVDRLGGSRNERCEEKGNEIGRASGRERGCQYVYISVDDVSLKNKYKQVQHRL